MSDNSYTICNRCSSVLSLLHGRRVDSWTSLRVMHASLLNCWCRDDCDPKIIVVNHDLKVIVGSSIFRECLRNGRSMSVFRISDVSFDGGRTSSDLRLNVCAVHCESDSKFCSCRHVVSVRRA